MMTTRTMLLNRIANHYWLKHPELKGFHVYLDRKYGAMPLCSDSGAITELNKMEIPGDHSGCCFKCYTELYGHNPLTPIQTMEIHHPEKREKP